MAESATFADFPSNVSMDQIRELGYALGLTIEDEDLEEVTYRFTALMSELNKLDQRDMESVDPMPIFKVEEEGI